MEETLALEGINAWRKRSGHFNSSEPSSSIMTTNARNHFSGRCKAPVKLLIRFPDETANNYLDRCYAHDRRFNGKDLTEYPKQINGRQYYPYFVI